MISPVSNAQDVITAINGIMATEDAQRRPERVQDFMSRVVVGESWVPEKFKECCSDDYTVRPLHVDPAGRFSICVMAWSPGQTTPIHDHIAWCVATVCHGTEIEEAFDLDVSGDAMRLRRLQTTTLTSGDAVIHMPVDGDIHRVTCGPGGNAISIHVYGCDISVAGSSIRKKFDEVPIAD